ncbi:hypothetical protein AgCh_024695 [Apium graveolens]
MQSATDPVQDGLTGIQVLPPAASMAEDEIRINARDKADTQLKWKAEEGVWVLKNGVILLNDRSTGDQQSLRKKMLVHLPTGQSVSSYNSMEQMLRELGWERYYGDIELLQFRKRNSIDLISLISPGSTRFTCTCV